MFAFKAALRALRIMSVGAASMEATFKTCCCHQKVRTPKMHWIIMIIIIKTYCSASLRLRQTPTWLGCGILSVTRRKKTCWLASHDKHSVYTSCFGILQRFFSFSFFKINKCTGKVSQSSVDSFFFRVFFNIIMNLTSSVYVWIFLIKLALKQSWLSTL